MLRVLQLFDSHFCDRLKPTYSKPTYSVQAIKNKVIFFFSVGN